MRHDSMGSARRINGGLRTVISARGGPKNAPSSAGKPGDQEVPESDGVRAAQANPAPGRLENRLYAQPDRKMGLESLIERSWHDIAEMRDHHRGAVDVGGVRMLLRVYLEACFDVAASFLGRAAPLGLVVLRFG